MQVSSIILTTFRHGDSKRTPEKPTQIRLKWKGYNSSFNSIINRKDIAWISEYFAKQKTLGGNVKVELDWSNYATKPDLKNATGAGRSDFAEKNWFR